MCQYVAQVAIIIQEPRPCTALNAPSATEVGHSAKISRGRELGDQSGASESLGGSTGGASGVRELPSGAAAGVASSDFWLARLDGAFFGGITSEYWSTRQRCK